MCLVSPAMFVSSHSRLSQYPRQGGSSSYSAEKENIFFPMSMNELTNLILIRFILPCCHGICGGFIVFIPVLGLNI